MPRPFAWSARSRQAAVLVADDHLTDQQIAADPRVGVYIKTLYLWKRRPEFRAAVAEHRAAFQAAIVAKGIAERQNRVEALNERWRLMRRVIEERAIAHENDAPGAGTGLLVRQEKVIGIGKGARTVIEWTVDGGLLSELRAHEKQAAIEVQQWVERGRQEVGGVGGGDLIFRVVYGDPPPKVD